MLWRWSTISSPLPPRVMTSFLCCRTCYSRGTMWWWWMRLTRDQCSLTFSLDSSPEYCLSEKRSDLTFCMQHLMQLLLWALRVLHSKILYYCQYFPPLSLQNGRPLKLVVMSATMRVEDFSNNPLLFPSPPPTLSVSPPSLPHWLPW